MMAPTPTARHTRAATKPDTSTKTGLKAFEDIEDISIVAAPGSTFGYENADYGIHAATIVNLLIAHVERMRYRIAVLDCGDRPDDSACADDARPLRFDIRRALLSRGFAFVDPVTRQEIHVPPSGLVAGIYARSDINRAVYKAPANEVVNLAIGFEHAAQQSPAGSA